MLLLCLPHLLPRWLRGHPPPISAVDLTPRRRPFDGSPSLRPFIRSDGITREEAARFDKLYARAILRSSLGFSALEMPSWQTLFEALRPAWKAPAPSRVSGQLLDDEYSHVMSETRKKLIRWASAAIAIDSATQKTGKSIINAMACGPMPFFIECIQMSIKRETAQILCKKALDLKGGLDVFLAEEQVEGSSEDITIASEGSHPLRFRAFCSDSCNQMRSPRRLLEPHMDLAYGCSAHALSNFCLDMLKIPGPAVALKKPMLMSKKIRSIDLLRKLHDRERGKQLGKALALKLFSPARWSSSNFMLSRLRAVKAAIASMPGAALHNEELDIQIPEALTPICADPSYWKGVSALNDLLSPTCKCLNRLEGDSAPISMIFASFLLVKKEIKRMSSEMKAGLNIAGAEIEALLKRLSYQHDRIYSPMLALAFRRDPHFDLHREQILTEEGHQFFDLGKGSLMDERRKSLKSMSNGDLEAEKQLLAELGEHCLAPRSAGPFSEIGKEMMPRLLWGRASDEHPNLSPKLADLFSAPANASAGERSHKTAKGALTTLRSRMGIDRAEKQAAIFFNAKQLSRAHPNHRAKEAEALLHSSSSASEAPDQMTNELEDRCSDYCESLEALRLEDTLENAESFSDMPDRALARDIDLQKAKTCKKLSFLAAAAQPLAGIRNKAF